MTTDNGDKSESNQIRKVLSATKKTIFYPKFTRHQCKGNEHICREVL